MAEYRADPDIAHAASALVAEFRGMAPDDVISVLAAALAGYAEIKSDRTGRALSEVLAGIETFMETHAGYLRQLSEKTKLERK